MKIINQSKNTVLAENAVMADKLFARLRGFLGRRELKAGQALILKPCNSVHTFFMRFCIDVIFVDKNNQVIKCLPSLKSYRLSAIYPLAVSVIELPPGSISTSNTACGDVLSFS